MGAWKLSAALRYLPPGSISAQSGLDHVRQLDGEAVSLSDEGFLC